MSKQTKPKIIAVVGPTASGKTKLAVALARKFDGEIVSADSRQVYRGMDIGTGKDLKDYDRIPCHLIDVADPNENYNLAEYQSSAIKAIKGILDKNKLPILAGGSGLYAQAVIDGYELNKVAPDPGLRNELEKLTAAELLEKLTKVNPVFAGKLNQSDRANKRRLLRYLEIALNPEIGKKMRVEKKPLFESLVIGIRRGREELEEKIRRRLIERLEKENMIGEVSGLYNRGVSWKRLESFGLEYKWLSFYLKEKIDHEEMMEGLLRDIKKFARRQMAWLRRWERQGRKICWVESEEEAEKLIEKFLDVDSPSCLT